MIEHLRALLDHDVKLASSTYNSEKGTLKDVGMDWALLSRKDDVIIVGFYRTSFSVSHKPKHCTRCRVQARLKFGTIATTEIGVSNG